MYVSWKLGSEFVSPAAAFPSRETCAWEHPSAYPKWKKRPQQETAREEREGNRSLVPQAGAMDLGERPGATDPDSEEIEEKSEAKPPTRFTEVLKEKSLEWKALQEKPKKVLAKSLVPLQNQSLWKLQVRQKGTPREYGESLGEGSGLWSSNGCGEDVCLRQPECHSAE